MVLPAAQPSVCWCMQFPNGLEIPIAMNETSSLLASPPHESVADLGWIRSLDALHRIRTLDDDWDGEGSVAPGAALVDGAIRLAIELRDRGMIPPDFVLTTDEGTVHFEWRGPHEYREIEVLSPVAGELRRFHKDAARNFTVLSFELDSYPMHESI